MHKLYFLSFLSLLSGGIIHAQYIEGPGKATIGSVATYFSPDDGGTYQWSVSSEGSISSSNSDSCIILWQNPGNGQVDLEKYSSQQQAFQPFDDKTVAVVNYLIEYDYDEVGNRIQLRVVEINDDKKSARSNKEIRKIVDETEGSLVYPNPADGVLFVKLDEDAPKDKNGKLILYSSQGKILYNSNIKDTLHEIDISGLQSGIYFLKIMYHNSSMHYKIIKR